MFIFIQGYTYIFAIWSLSNLSIHCNEFQNNALMHTNLTHSSNPIEGKSATANFSVILERKTALNSIKPSK
jgi:hypothetical protein